MRAVIKPNLKRNCKKASEKLVRDIAKGAVKKRKQVSAN